MRLMDAGEYVMFRPQNNRLRKVEAQRHPMALAVEGSLTEIGWETGGRMGISLMTVDGIPTESASGEMPTYRTDEVIDRCSVSPLQLTVIALCAMVTIIDGFDAQSIGVLASPIAHSFRVDVRSFGPVFSIGLVGLMAGALTMGPIGDRWGRRRALIAAVLTVGSLTGLTAFAHNLNELLLLRLLAGFGLGGAMPSTMSLVAEYTPQRWRALAICFSAACIPIGGMLAGLGAALLLPVYGWRLIFAIGGVVPLLIACCLLIGLPESVRYLNLRPANDQRVRRIMARIWPQGPGMNAVFLPPLSVAKPAGIPMVELFREGRAPLTLLLWLTYFMNLLILYLIVSWMPALFKAEGLAHQTGALAISAFGFGGVVGSLAQAPLMKRFTSRNVLVVEFAIFTLVAIALFALPTTPTSAIAAALVIGWAIQGAQAGLNVFSATFYPTSVRSTGIGWGLGIGRLGSILGPLLGGGALIAGWHPREIFVAAAIPAVCAGLAVVLTGTLQARRTVAAANALPFAAAP